jgi:hypothetical protein
MFLEQNVVITFDNGIYLGTSRYYFEEQILCITADDLQQILGFK